VFGDNGKLYVPAELVEIYRKEVIPLANVVTPNQFEAEQLTGISIKSMQDAKKAISALHDLGPELVVLTSMVLEGESDKMYIVASQRHNLESGETNNLWQIESPILSGTYTGTGDLTAALFLAWTAKDPNNMGKTLEKVVSTMFTIIQKTQKESDGTVQGKELKLIASKEVIENPPELFKATQSFI
jgi:pyridoxine kinase